MSFKISDQLTREKKKINGGIEEEGVRVKIRMFQLIQVYDEWLDYIFLHFCTRRKIEKLTTCKDDSGFFSSVMMREMMVQRWFDISLICTCLVRNMQNSVITLHAKQSEV